MGDAAATFVSALGGGTGQTTYAENIGVMSITKVFSIRPLQVAAVTAILLGLVPKFGAFIAPSRCPSWRDLVPALRPDRRDEQQGHLHGRRGLGNPGEFRRLRHLGRALHRHGGEERDPDLWGVVLDPIGPPLSRRCS